MTHTTRRRFLGQSAAWAAGYWIAGVQRGYGQERSPNARLNVAQIGVGGMRGEANMNGVATETMVALCDVDQRSFKKAVARHPKAAVYADFRKMLEKEKGVDAVVVSTPDHIHAVAAVAAMRLGKHVYCEKPQAYSVAETRLMTETAARRKVATQLGNQMHASDNYRRVVELVRSGVIGRIKEVHNYRKGAWTANRPPRPTPCPPQLDWDLWLGPAEERPHSRELAPFGWRRFWHFAGGHLADMGCHHLDLPFWALKLKAPKTVSAEGPPPHPHGAPPILKVKWRFEADGDQPAVDLYWYHGEEAPAIFTQGDVTWRSGNLFIGDKGMLFSGYKGWKLLPESKFRDFTPPAPTIPPSPGHHAEWLDACRGGAAGGTNFSYGGPLTECVLLGNVAYRTGETLEWDAATMKVNVPAAEPFLRRAFRKGWDPAG